MHEAKDSVDYRDKGKGRSIEPPTPDLESAEVSRRGIEKEEGESEGEIVEVDLS